ncbi:hypothetical protein L596_027989 [Steinernema carpocapsae]|uniref:Piezo TM1-24 domain-containing protein n=1 Tax=Steinernema carpocapsae TaxID=34508 RepID=A0A4U5LX52_STECR|nr:hypothetical protein L596_027989 [Steinernema carpocapsae]
MIANLNSRVLPLAQSSNEGGGASQVLRQIGFENIRQANSLLIVRIFFPEVIVLTACCILLLRVKFQKTQKFSEESVSDVPSQSEIDEQEEWKQFLSNQKLRSYLDHAQNVLTCVLCAVSGCIFPSILNAVYFVTFVFIATSWAFHRRTLTQRMCSHTCRWLLPYMAFHLILLYAFQFPFIQRFIIPHGVVARLFGLIQYLRYPCEKLPYPIEVIVWRWTEFAMPAVVFVSYTALAVVMVLKREQFEIVISKANGGLTSPVHELRAQSLISPTDSKTHDEDYINIEKSRSLDISRVRRGEEPRRASLKFLTEHTSLNDKTIIRCLQLVRSQSYVFTLLVMMVSAVSWLKEHFWAAAWLVPKREDECRRALEGLDPIMGETKGPIWLRIQLLKCAAWCASNCLRFMRFESLRIQETRRRRMCQQQPKEIHL